MNLREFLLLKLAEEATEIAHRASKCIQYGMADVQKNGDGANNAERLFREITDLHIWLELLAQADVFNFEELKEQDEGDHLTSKWFSILEYAKMSRDLLKLTPDGYARLESIMNGGRERAR